MDYLKDIIEMATQGLTLGEETDWDPQVLKDALEGVLGLARRALQTEPVIITIGSGKDFEILGVVMASRDLDWDTLVKELNHDFFTSDELWPGAMEWLRRRGFPAIDARVVNI